jgi:arylsulfatase
MPPNIILIMTDQQRADSIGALGSPWMHTPNLDRLVAEGTAFTNCFVTSPVCVGARASLFNGMYPHATGIFSNFQPWKPNWIQWLADAGYHCASIGKMHINPYDELGGFHQRFAVENKDRPLFLEEHDRAFYDEWDKALFARKLMKPSRYTRLAEDGAGFLAALGCFDWPIDEDMHPDFFIGDTATWWLEERKAESPLFLQIGFPGPHPPYDPVRRYLDQYADADIPVPTVGADELAAQPPMHAALRQNMIDYNIDSVAWRENPSSEDLLRLRRHYAANVTMIDEKVGQIMEALQRRGYLDDAIVIFTSDHADALGDHGHIQKWTMYDTVTRVPLIVWSPGRAAAGQVHDGLVQLMDIAPTVLECAGVPVPERWEAKSLTPALVPGAEESIRDVVYSELGRDHIQPYSEYLVMRRDQDWKIVYYLGEEAGELYDLNADPGETKNLWNHAGHRELRERLLRDLLEWSVTGMHRGGMPEGRKPQAPMRIEK